VNLTCRPVSAFTLVDLSLEIVHRLELKADEELLEDLKPVGRGRGLQLS
jgi:hypothetical protein